MKVADASQQLWYKDVVQPKLQQLKQALSGELKLEEVVTKSFLKQFLADLEMIELANDHSEYLSEKILDGVDFYRQDHKINFVNKNLAFVALLKNPLDRIVYQEYWQLYRPLKKSGKIKDESIVNAYLLKQNLSTLINFVENAADVKSGDVQTKKAS